MSFRWSLLLACSCVGTADMVVVPQVAPPQPEQVLPDAGSPREFDAGTVALLVVRGTGMFLVKLRADGSAIFETAIVNDPPSEIEGARWVDGWGHEGRLLFTGQVYVAYFGHTKHWGAMGKHQGDLLISL